MRLEFKCLTNKDYVMINSAKFRLQNGTEITVDRYVTEFTYDNGNLNMQWRNTYIWDDDIELPLTKAVLDGAEFIEFELEDDADEDYYVEVETWRMS